MQAIFEVTRVVLHMLPLIPHDSLASGRYNLRIAIGVFKNSKEVGTLCNETQDGQILDIIQEMTCANALGGQYVQISRFNVDPSHPPLPIHSLEVFVLQPTLDSGNELLMILAI